VQKLALQFKATLEAITDRSSPFCRFPRPGKTSRVAEADHVPLPCFLRILAIPAYLAVIFRPSPPPKTPQPLSVKPQGEDFDWQIKAQCSSCREEHSSWMGVDATVRFSLFFLSLLDSTMLMLLNEQESREISGSRGEANLVWRCQLCKREHSISSSHPFSPFSLSRTDELTTKQTSTTPSSATKPLTRSKSQRSRSSERWRCSSAEGVRSSNGTVRCVLTVLSFLHELFSLLDVLIEA
jgi:hypothetical protein